MFRVDVPPRVDLVHRQLSIPIKLVGQLVAKPTQRSRPALRQESAMEAAMQLLPLRVFLVTLGTRRPPHSNQPVTRHHQGLLPSRSRRSHGLPQRRLLQPAPGLRQLHQLLGTYSRHGEPALIQECHQAIRSEPVQRLPQRRLSRPIPIHQRLHRQPAPRRKRPGQQIVPQSVVNAARPRLPGDPVRRQRTRKKCLGDRHDPDHRAKTGNLATRLFRLYRM